MFSQFIEDLSKARFTATSKWETSYDSKLLPKGKYLENLAIARKAVEEELGHEKWKEIHKTNKFLDVFICFTIPLLGWIMMYYTFTISMTSPWFWIAATVQGWATLCSFLAYHDIIAHRASFGLWGSWLVGAWMASHGMLANGLHALWGSRHCMTHHKQTFEAVDCDLSGHDMKSRWTRFIFINGALRQFIRLQFWRDMDSKYNYQAVDTWYPGPLGKAKKFQMKVDLVNRHTRNFIYLVMIYFWPVETLRMLLVPQAIMGIFDSVRYVFEHSEHDRYNPFWHSTLYRSNSLVRFLWFGEIGDCHSVHHLFPRVPLYNMGLATSYLSPLLIKRGVTERVSFWEILYGYYILALPHGERWDNLDWYGKVKKN